MKTHGGVDVLTLGGEMSASRDGRVVSSQEAATILNPTGTRTSLPLSRFWGDRIDAMSG
jgi:hypothetical protein